MRKASCGRRSGWPERFGERGRDHPIQETPAGKFVFARFGATLTLLPPGTRKANRFWMIRGTLSDGRRLEVSTKAAKKIHDVRIAYELAVWRNRTEARSTRRARRGGME